MAERIIDKENVVPHHFNPQGTHIPPHGHVHEDRDVPIRSIFRFSVLLAVVTIASCLLLWGMFEILDSRSESAVVDISPLSKLGEPPPGPLLQPTPMNDLTPRQDMNAFRALEDSALAGGMPLDSVTGARPIPIDQAIEMLVQKGWTPPRATGTGELPGDTATAGAPIGQPALRRAN